METITIVCTEHHQHVVTKNEMEEYWKQLGSPAIQDNEDMEMLMCFTVDKLHALLN